MLGFMSMRNTHFCIKIQWITLSYATIKSEFSILIVFSTHSFYPFNKYLVI